MFHVVPDLIDWIDWILDRLHAKVRPGRQDSRHKLIRETLLFSVLYNGMPWHIHWTKSSAKKFENYWSNQCRSKQINSDHWESGRTEEQLWVVYPRYRFPPLSENRAFLWNFHKLKWSKEANAVFHTNENPLWFLSVSENIYLCRSFVKSKWHSANMKIREYLYFFTFLSLLSWSSSIGLWVPYAGL